MLESLQLAESKEVGFLNVKHLKRYWHKNRLLISGEIKQDTLLNEWNIDITLLGVLNIGIEQTVKYLHEENPDFETLENWILHLNNGKLNNLKIEQFNNYIDTMKVAYIANEAEDRVLSESDMNFWNENGYIIIRNAVSKEDCECTIEAICNYIDIERYNSNTWYSPHTAKQGIMVQLFQHPALEKNRNSPIIRKAYEQLWQRKDLWINADRVGFNPPETETWKFPGPRMHWDVSLKMPIPFGTQGILYLSDTAYNQGAFSLVPGFHNRIETWLHNLPPDVQPRNENIYSLGVQPIVANAGDFIIWHHALPHGSSVNSSNQPRFVQYMNYEPLDAFKQDKWV